MKYEPIRRVKITDICQDFYNLRQKGSGQNLMPSSTRNELSKTIDLLSNVYGDLDIVKNDVGSKEMKTTLMKGKKRQTNEVEFMERDPKNPRIEIINVENYNPTTMVIDSS